MVDEFAANIRRQQEQLPAEDAADPAQLPIDAELDAEEAAGIALDQLAGGNILVEALTEPELRTAFGWMTDEAFVAAAAAELEAAGIYNRDADTSDPHSDSLSHQVKWYYDRLDYPYTPGNEHTLRQYLHTLVDIHKVRHNTTDEALNDTLRLERKMHPNSLCPPSYHIVKRLMKVKALQECEWHICASCLKWAWPPMPDRTAWEVVSDGVKGQRSDFSCYACGAARFMIVQRPGDRQEEIKPTMVGNIR
jgi:hypothetical protein